jgi:hypothetical protein
MHSAGSPVRSIKDLMTVAASSWACSGASDPPNAPTAVRNGSQMTTSFPAEAGVAALARFCPLKGPRR